MRFMSDTDDVFQPERSPLKEVASENMSFISVTAETSHPDRFAPPVKADAPLNMLSESMRLDVFHADRSESKARAL